MKTTVQVLLSLPATLLCPLGWLAFPMGYSAQFDGPAFLYFAKALLFFLFSLVGLISLWVSIFRVAAKNPAPPSRGVVVGLLVGLIGSGVLLVGFLVSSPRGADAGLLSLWLIGGPIAVGWWNLDTLQRQEGGPRNAPPNGGTSETSD